MKIFRKTSFWFVQIIGWGIPSFINTSGKIFMNIKLSTTYIVCEGLLFFLSGILVTSILRNYYKKHISIHNLSKNDVLKISIATIISALLFSASIFIALLIYPLFHTESWELTTKSILINLINCFIYILFWTLLYFGIIHNRKSKTERLQLIASLKESQLNTLKGQINPHFMFNCLNNIRGLMLEDVEKSREMITRLSEMLRYSLTKNDVDTIVLKEELEMVENYIALSKIQLEDKLEFRKTIDSELLNAKIPPMIIQMLIENAIKHGISNLRKGGVVDLIISKESRQIMIQVINTGTLVSKNNATKVGLQNIQKRIRLLYKKKGSFSLKEINNTIIAIIKIPIC